MFDYNKMEKSCPTGSFAYTIKSGDTLYKLAITYNTTVEAIMRINPGINPNRLQIGQRICIPKGSQPPTPSCPTGTFAYTIKSGDTLYHLAMTYNTTVEEILKANPGIDPNNLRIGQVICIPRGSQPPTTCPTGTFAYTIKSGDTLYQLAITYNTTVEAIMRVNPGIDPNNLRIGQVICIPRATPPPTTCPTGTFAYTIKSGDTLYQLAITYNTTVEAIMRVNPGIDPNNLRIGQVICIPRGGQPPTCDGFIYVVRPGDTIYMLSITFKVSVEAIIAANPGINPNNLQVGQLICIPRSQPMPCPGGTLYTVTAQDSLTSILLRFNISIMDLMAGNPNIDVNKLVVGQQLCILPHKDRGCPCPPGAQSYIILPGDQSGNIAVVIALSNKFNIPVSSIMMANQNLSPGDFKPGVKVCIPKM